MNKFLPTIIIKLIGSVSNYHHIVMSAVFAIVLLSSLLCAMEADIEETPSLLALPISFLFKQGSSENNSLQLNLNETELFTHDYFHKLLDDRDETTIGIVGTMEPINDSSNNEKLQFQWHCYEGEGLVHYHSQCTIDPETRKSLATPLMLFSLKKNPYHCRFLRVHEEHKDQPTLDRWVPISPSTDQRHEHKWQLFLPLGLATAGLLILGNSILHEPKTDFVSGTVAAFFLNAVTILAYMMNINNIDNAAD